MRRLVLIRWVAIAGQALTLLIVHYGFGFRLPLLPALGVVGCSVLLNLLVSLYRRAATRLGEREAALFLGYDLLQLAVLLYLTGGLENPFSILILAPVTVAATVLSLRPVIALAVFAVAMITCWRCGTCRCRGATVAAGIPAELVLGLWTALVLATVFIGGYAWSVAAGGAAAARRGGGDAAGAGARAAGLGGRRAGRSGGARTRQPARDDRGRRQGAGARPAARFAACRGRGSCC